MSDNIARLRARRTELDHKLAVARDKITALQADRTKLAAERATVVAELAKATTAESGKRLDGLAKATGKKGAKR